MRQSSVVAGSFLFLLIAPGCAAGLVPWWITHWIQRPPWFGFGMFRIAGVAMIVIGSPMVLDSFARFALQAWAHPLRSRRLSAWSLPSTRAQSHVRWSDDGDLWTGVIIGQGWASGLWSLGLALLLRFRPSLRRAEIAKHLYQLLPQRSSMDSADAFVAGLGLFP